MNFYAAIQTDYNDRKHSQTQIHSSNTSSDEKLLEYNQKGDRAHQRSRHRVKLRGQALYIAARHMHKLSLQRS